MQPIDVVLPAVLAGIALGALRTARRRRSLLMPAPGRLGTHGNTAAAALLTLTGAVAAQLTLGGWRWQLAPASLAALLLTVVLAARASGRQVRLAGTVAAIALIGATVSLALSWALPVRILPAPDGPHAVGTTTVVVEDEQRLERYGPRPGGAREIVVQVWYPAVVPSAAPTAPLIPQAATFTNLGAAELGLPRFALGHLGAIPSNAITDAPAIDGPLPVALLAHGWTGFRTIQSDLAEQLASLGWIVAAADHRYGALITTFPDGRAELFDPEALPEFGSVPDDVYAERSRRLIDTFALDLALVLRMLERHPPEQLAGRIELTRVAFLGHSTGGGAAIAACAVETRCRAVVGFDPWVEPVDPDVLRRGTDRPLLSLRTQDWAGRPNEAVLQALHDTHRARGMVEGLVGLEGALHRDFTLIGALSPAARLLGFAGDTPDAHTREATIAWTTRFLDHHVRGLGTDPFVDPPDTRIGRLEVAP
jgi:predicted dienelactone hydrolase